jgi:hypothetical protein
MAIQIRDGGFLENRMLTIEPRGVRVLQTVAFGRGQFVPFEQIDYVLLAGNGLLSIQYGREVFKIQTSSLNKKHAAAIRALLDGVQRNAAAPPVLPAGG